MSGHVQPGGAGTPAAGSGTPQAIQGALARLTDRLDELARRLPGLVSDPGELPGSLLDEAERRDLADLRAVLAVGSAPMPVERSLQLLLDRAVYQCEADVAAVLVPGVDGELILAGALGLEGTDEIRARVSGSVAERAFREGEIVRGDAAVAPRDALMRTCGLSAVVALPAPGGTRAPRGVLVAGRRRAVPFATGSLRRLLLLADRLGLVLAVPDGPAVAAPSAPVTTDVKTERSTGRSVGQGLIGELDLELVARGVVDVAAERLGGASVALLLPEATGFVVAARSWLPQSSRPRTASGGTNGWPRGEEPDVFLASGDNGLLAAVLQSRQAWIPREGDDSRALEELLGRPPRAVVPLVVSERVVALLAVGAGEPVAAERLDPIAPEAAMAIRNARLYRDAVLGLAEVRGARAAPTPPPPPARDLSNLVAVVLGRLASLRDRVTDPDAQRDVDVAEEAAWRAAEAMRDLLGFAPGRRGTALAPLDLGAVVHEAVAATIVRRTAVGPPPRIQVDLEVVPPVRGSAEDLREMLDHLLDNALEASPADATVLVRARWDGGAHVELDVVDAGVGMDDAIRSRALEPFFSTRGDGHLGLGLPVARAIVARHNGELTLRSEPDQGTTVEVRLPTVASVRRPTGASTPVARILLVEDEPPVREALLAALSQQGHVVHVAADGRAALAILEREPLDAIVTDLALPGVSGLEVARVAKELRPGIPVILVTAWPAGPDAARLEASGVDAVIDKPIGLSEFRATLALALARRSGSTA